MRTAPLFLAMLVAAASPHALGQDAASADGAPLAQSAPYRATPGVKDGGSLAGKDSFEASSTISSSHASL